MNGFWFAATVGVLVFAGVATQLGWRLPSIAEVRQALERGRPEVGPRGVAGQVRTGKDTQFDTPGSVGTRP